MTRDAHLSILACVPILDQAQSIYRHFKQTGNHLDEAGTWPRSELLHRADCVYGVVFIACTATRIGAAFGAAQSPKMNHASASAPAMRLMTTYLRPNAYAASGPWGLREPIRVPMLGVSLYTLGFTMLSAIVALAIFGFIALAWMNTRDAAEVASHYGRRACQEGGVQWLDHTVMLERLTFKRAPDGWIRPLRRYRFEFSTDGIDRHRGQLELLSNELQWVNMPPPPASQSSSVIEVHSQQINLPSPPSDRSAT